jgi:hypothetical protein
MKTATAKVGSNRASGLRNKLQNITTLSNSRKPKRLHLFLGRDGMWLRRNAQQTTDTVKMDTHSAAGIGAQASGYAC